MANQTALKTRFGPWALVTGASDGIGREFAIRLAEDGINVILVARRGDILELLASKLAEENGIQTQVVSADLSLLVEVERLLKTVAHLDIGLLVACAGFGTSGPFMAQPVDDEIEMLDVNCRAVLFMTHHFARRFVRAERGGIVLMSSIVAFQGVPRACNYAATKAYIQTLAEGLRVELAPHGVAVVASAPGPIRSGFAERANMSLGMAQNPSAVARETLAALGRKTTVRPGWLAKFLSAALTVPRWARVRIMTLVMGGMTKHQGT